MLNITDVAQEQKITPFFRLGFRPFFLSACLFSLIALPIWLAYLIFHIDVAPYGGSFWWHGHEMIFGFAVPVIVGFLLTAVQNWTGIQGVRGGKLVLLFGVWLLGRALLLFNPASLPPLLIALIDLIFLPVAAIMISWPIVRIKQWRNLFFLPLLLLLTLMNALSHLSVISGEAYPAAMSHGHYGAIMIITAVMVVMGGRVIPFFTANATKKPRKPAHLWLEVISLVSVWMVTFWFVFGMNFSITTQYPIGFLVLIAGLSNLMRWSRWRFFSTLSNPLLWSLHIAYLFIPVAFLFLAGHLLLGYFSLSTVLHLMTVGAMANLILAMIARVSLGHTGRKLELHAVMPFAFILMILAALLRFVGTSYVPQYSTIVWLITGVLWFVAFGIFSWVYWPILTKPRADGRPG